MTEWVGEEAVSWGGTVCAARLCCELGRQSRWASPHFPDAGRGGKGTGCAMNRGMDKTKAHGPVLFLPPKTTPRNGSWSQWEGDFGNKALGVGDRGL